MQSCMGVGVFLCFRISPKQESKQVGSYLPYWMDGHRFFLCAFILRRVHTQQQAGEEGQNNEIEVVRQVMPHPLMVKGQKIINEKKTERQVRQVD